MNDQTRCRLLAALFAACLAVPSARAALQTVTVQADRATQQRKGAAVVDHQAIARAAEAASKWLAAGRPGEALAAMLPLADSIAGASPVALRARAQALMGRAYLQSGRLDDAEVWMSQAMDTARQASQPVLQAELLNDLGLLQVARKDDTGALLRLAEALELSRAERRSPLVTQVLLNTADVHARRGDPGRVRQLLGEAAAAAESIPPSAGRALLQTAVAARLLDMSENPDEAATAVVGQALRSAYSDARAAGNSRIQAEVLGLSGRLAMQLGEVDVSLRDTRRAIFAAQAGSAPDLLYKWEWQAARILRRQGRDDESLGFYRKAAATLQPVRHDLLMALRGSSGSYRDTIGPMYTELADGLLQRSSQVDGDQRQALLREARETIEQLKTVELEDYFRDDCVAEFQQRRLKGADLPRGTAVIYPIVLPDRLDILIDVNAKIERVSVRVGSDRLSAEAISFRRKLENRASGDYAAHGRQLYSWLIAPIADQIEAAKADTLVVVPDGPLLGIPFSALNDGNRFLIERFAVATVPGLHLVEPRSGRQVSRAALVSGLSESVQGFPALPAVQGELADIAARYVRSVELKDSSFTLSRVDALADANTFGAMHIASHGEFDQNPRNTFLLTYDGKMGMDELAGVVRRGRMPDDPLDLLTLSACRTAAGDERSALGLAGVAIKAGARSVIATLWYINDEASSRLIRDFYGYLLGAQDLSKAKALRAAQLRLMANPEYRHPGYWAPFLVIGNWN